MKQRNSVSSFLQTPAWQGFQEALGRTTYTDAGDGWSYLAIRESGTLNTRLYTPYGPQCDSLQAFDAALASLTARAKAEGATFLRVEPMYGVNTEDLRKRGFHPVTYQQLQPSHTQLIDLTPAAEEILAGMSQNSRNITRNYHKKGLTIRVSQDLHDITILTSLLRTVAVRNRITTHTDEYFTRQAEVLFKHKVASLYIAEYEEQPIAAALVYDTDTTRTYAHAAADDQYRKLSAGTAIVGQMILDAKEAGLTQVDLYGIADTDDPSHPWAGFTRFKKSFGGRSVTYSGAWDLPLNKPGYWVYRGYQTIRRKLR